MSIKDLVHKAEEKMKHSVDSTNREFSEIRTGRANASMVDGLHADYYGTPTMLKQLASITVPDAHMLVIQPWDPTSIQEIEKAILKSNLGINPSNDGKVIRLVVPQLSKERRQELVKVVKNMSENGRISLRTIRRDINEAIKKMQDDKVIAEDDRFKAQDEIQKLTDKYIQKVDQLLKEKEAELEHF